MKKRGRQKNKEKTVYFNDWEHTCVARRWTLLAAQCLSVGARCGDCPANIPHILPGLDCNVKYIVVKLIKQETKPNRALWLDYDCLRNIYESPHKQGGWASKKESEETNE